ncbi:MAG: type II toxin-antitoxin system RelE family toxin [Thermoproteota archaeon]
MKEKFEVKSTPLFLKRIKVLSEEVQIRILREVKVLKTNPYIGKSLRGEWKGILSLRVGNYRILYQIKGNEIILLAVGHRKHVYK